MSRIINRQRQMAEQGRIRLGFTAEAANGKTRPARSETFILTSHSKEHIDAAANLWGGDVEHWQPQGNGAQQWRVITRAATLPAILPPGDPLTQAHEMWTKGGCQRRCNGATEELSGSPCMCLAEFGPDWYEQKPDKVCQTKSRLKVLLPDMPGLGTWRMETGSFYATDEIAGMVDFIRGAVGGQALVPVSLRIEQRTRIAQGKTKHFPVPVIDLRDVTAGALMAGQVQTLGALQSSGGGQQPAALETRKQQEQSTVGQEQVTIPTPEQISDADLPTLRKMVAYLEQHGAGEHTATSTARSRIEAIEQLHEQPNADGSYDAHVVDEQPAQAAQQPAGEADGDAVWQQIVTEAGRQGMTLPQVTEDFSAVMGGLIAADATAGELNAYLEQLRAGGEQVAS